MTRFSSDSLVFDRFRLQPYRASRRMAGEVTWCPVTERCVRATLIVFPPPCFDELSTFLQIEEPVGFRHSPRRVPLKLSTKSLSVHVESRSHRVVVRIEGCRETRFGRSCSTRYRCR